MIYLDNAATSFPKPSETVEALNRFVLEVGGNPGRSGHTLSVDAARIVFEAREKLTAFVKGSDSERLIFTANGTESLNLALLGLLREGDHVITTSMEHNSVMRPLLFLSTHRGVEYSVAGCGPDGLLDPEVIQRLVKKNTRAVVVNHGSNVIGTVQPLKAVRAVIGDVLLIVDACQTVGSHPVDVAGDGIDILCFSCHKSLFSIQGLGAVYIREGIELMPLKFGGTGSKSESIEHPEFLPDRYESGTPNTPGIASLLGGLSFIERVGLKTIAGHERVLRDLLAEGLSAVRGVTLYGAKAGTPCLPVLSFNMEGKLPSEVGYELNRREIYGRVGLQCSPMAHRTIGTFPRGTVRVSPGYFTTEEEISRFLEAIQEIGRT